MSSSNYGSISQPAAGSSSSNNFSPTEFFILKETIGTNIVAIKKQYVKLEKIQRIIGSKNDTNETRAKMWVMLWAFIITTTSNDLYFFLVKTFKKIQTMSSKRLRATSKN